MCSTLSVRCGAIEMTDATIIIVAVVAFVVVRGSGDDARTG